MTRPAGRAHGEQTDVNGPRGARIPKRRLLSQRGLCSDSHVESAKECIGIPSNGADVLMNAYRETTGDNATSASETPQLSFAPGLGLAPFNLIVFPSSLHQVLLFLCFLVSLEAAVETVETQGKRLSGKFTFKLP